MIHPLWSILIPALVWTIGQAQDGLAPVVMVADVVGKVSRGGGQLVALAEGIPAQRELKLEAGGRLVVIHLKTGEAFTFTGPAVVRFDTEGRSLGTRPTAHRQVASLQAGFRLEPGAWAQASVVMRKEAFQGEPFLKPEAPLPFNPEPAIDGAGVWSRPRGSAVLENRPEFRWHLPVPGLVARLRIVDPAGAAVVDEAVQGEMLRLREEQALQPGGDYRWRLTWTLPEGREMRAEGEVRVLPEAEARLIRSLRPGQAAQFSERLAFAVALESRGLADEARPYWLQLVSERPGDATLQRFAAR